MDDSSIQVFDNQDFGHLRVTMQGGEPWFVAKDVCDALDIGNSRQALSRIDDDEKGVTLNDTLGGRQQVQTVNEAGLYTLVLSSRKPEAHAFRRWVTHDVLPTIRRHGVYATPQSVEAMLSDPDTMIATLTELKSERQRSARLADENAALAPKAAYYDAVMDSDGLLSVRDSAKLMKSYDRSVTECGLRSKLRSDRVIERRTRKATAYGIQRGYVKERPFVITHHDGSQTIDHYGCLTPKGLDWCIRRYCKEVS